MTLRVMGRLEILGYDEVRGVIGDVGPRGEGFQSLVPTKNPVAVVHVRFPGGEPFSMTVDGETFNREFLPAFKAREEAATSPS